MEHPVLSTRGRESFSLFIGGICPFVRRRRKREFVHYAVRSSLAATFLAPAADVANDSLDAVAVHGCQMAIAGFLDHMCLALRASGLWLRFATLQLFDPFLSNFVIWQHCRRN